MMRNVCKSKACLPFHLPLLWFDAIKKRS